MAPDLTDTEPTELEQLLEEIQRYLAVVDAFRAEGAAPIWASDEAAPDWWLDEHLPRRVQREPERAAL